MDYKIIWDEYEKIKMEKPPLFFSWNEMRKYHEERIKRLVKVYEKLKDVKEKQ